MEYISSSQLHNYKSLIEEIHNEHERSKDIRKEIRLANDYLLAIKLAQMQNNIKENISYVNVRIFRNLFDIYDLYGSQISKADLHHTFRQGYAYYVVTIFITKCLHSVLLQNKWFLNITVRSDILCFNRTVALSDRVPILEVVPIREDIKETVIEIILFSNINGNMVTLRLEEINVNISYQFSDVKDANQDIGTCNENLFKLLQQYEIPGDNLRLKLPILEYQLFSNVSTKQFAQAVLKNCYCNMDIEIFADSTDDSMKDIIIKFRTNSRNKSLLIYNCNKKSLKIKSNVEDMHLIKKYFLFELGINEDIVSKNLKKLSTFNCEACEDITKFYKELRSIL